MAARDWALENQAPDSGLQRFDRRWRLRAQTAWQATEELLRPLPPPQSRNITYHDQDRVGRLVKALIKAHDIRRAGSPDIASPDRSGVRRDTGAVGRRPSAPRREATKPDRSRNRATPTDRASFCFDLSAGMTGGVPYDRPRSSTLIEILRRKRLEVGCLVQPGVGVPLASDLCVDPTDHFRIRKALVSRKPCAPRSGSFRSSLSGAEPRPDRAPERSPQGRSGPREREGQPIVEPGNFGPRQVEPHQRCGKRRARRLALKQDRQSVIGNPLWRCSS